MRLSEKLRIPALLCAFAVIFCALLAQPFTQNGVIDDWSYIRTVHLLVQTGHIVYNGWSRPMLGWQLWIGAAFVKLFGFSTTVVRMSILLVSAALAFLLQRILVRVGLNEWNAALATLTYVLSPLFLPLSVIFITDVPGVFAMVVCLYGCLRAVQAASQATGSGWIAFAAIASAIGGTARQTSWLGLLVMVPCTIWLLRKQRRVALAGVLSVLAGLVIVAASMHWLKHQPNIDPEPAMLKVLTLNELGHLGTQSLRMPIFAACLLSPVLLMFFPAVRRNARIAYAIAAVAVAALLAALHDHLPQLPPPFFPAKGNIIANAGIWQAPPAFGIRPEWPVAHAKYILAAVSLLCLLAPLTVAFLQKKIPVQPDRQPRISWHNLLFLLLPFLLAYLAALLPRESGNGLYDRYQLPVLLVVLIFAVRFYQDYVRVRLPSLTAALILLIAVFSVTGLHDLFAMFRATSAAAAEVHASGVPVTAIEAGFEYDGQNEIEAAGFVKVPDDFPPDHSARKCKQSFATIFLHIDPQYTMAFDPNECGGPTQFAPVTYSMWLPHRQVSIFVVKDQ